jgi:LysR family transcriptional regulator, nod-box dependent transcriptional activator
VRFHGLDLNLLVVLDRLLIDRNVSRASERLNLSQPATSGALARLREHLGDELLVQAGRSLVLTPRAQALAPAVRAILVQIENKLLSKSVFDPAASDRHFRIIASDYACLVALRYGLAAISRVSPGMRFDILPFSDEPFNGLERGEADLLIFPEPYLSSDHPSELLFEDAYVCVVDKANKRIGNSLTFEEYLAGPHAIVRFSMTRQPALEDWFVRHYGHVRAIEVITSNHATLPFFVVGTDRIATLHERHCRLVANYLPLRVLPVPVEIPPIKEMIQWHAVNDGDEALAWVRQMLIMNQMPAVPGKAVSDNRSQRLTRGRAAA